MAIVESRGILQTLWKQGTLMSTLWLTSAGAGSWSRPRLWWGFHDNFQHDNDGEIRKEFPVSSRVTTRQHQLDCTHSSLHISSPAARSDGNCLNNSCYSIIIINTSSKHSPCLKTKLIRYDTYRRLHPYHQHLVHWDMSAARHSIFQLTPFA